MRVKDSCKIQKDRLDHDFIKAHANGFTEFCDFVVAFTPAAATGLSSAQLEEMARLTSDGKRVPFWWTMGVNQGYESANQRRRGLTWEGGSGTLWGLKNNNPLQDPTLNES